MRPAEGHQDLETQCLVHAVTVGIDDAFGVFAQMIAGNLSRAGGLQEKDHRVISDDHPQPPAVALFALYFFKDQPARLIHLPVVGGAATFQDSGIDRLKEFAQTPQSAGERALRNGKPFEREHLANPIEWPLEKELLHQHPEPRTKWRTYPCGSAWAGRARR